MRVCKNCGEDVLLRDGMIKCPTCGSDIDKEIIEKTNKKKGK